MGNLGSPHWRSAAVVRQGGEGTVQGGGGLLGGWSASEARRQSVSRVVVVDWSRSSPAASGFLWQWRWLLAPIGQKEDIVS
jgi:hypothetical protein